MKRPPPAPERGARQRRCQLPRPSRRKRASGKGGKQGADVTSDKRREDGPAIGEQARAAQQLRFDKILKVLTLSQTTATEPLYKNCWGLRHTAKVSRRPLSYSPTLLAFEHVYRTKEVVHHHGLCLVWRSGVDAGPGVLFRAGTWRLEHSVSWCYSRAKGHRAGATGKQ